MQFITVWSVPVLICLRLCQNVVNKGYACCRHYLLLWYMHSGVLKGQFVPALVGPFLEVTLVPENELRQTTLPIFYDLIECEQQKRGNFSQVWFFNCLLRNASFCLNGYVNSRHSAFWIDFRVFMWQVESEIVDKLDILINTGKGDYDYKQQFATVYVLTF